MLVRMSADDTAPESAAPQKRKSNTLLIVLAILGGLCLLGGGAIVAVVATAVPQVQERQKRLQCQRNLSAFGLDMTRWMLEHDLEQPGWPAAYVEYVKSGVRSGALQMDCPGDPAVSGGQPAPSGHCSFAIRDFDRYPLEMDSPERQIIACDRMGDDGRTPHHDGGLIVLFDNGSSMWMDRESLGLGPDDPIVVGPASTHPLLKQVVDISSR